MKDRAQDLIESLKRLFVHNSFISWAAMAVSLGTFYLTTLDPPDLKIQPGQSFQIWHDSGAQLQIDYPLNFANDGARTGTIVSLALILESDWIDQPLLCKWGGTKVYDNGWKFASRERPISVRPGETVDEMINFGCGAASSNLLPEVGEITLNFVAWTGSSERPAASSGLRISLDEADRRQVANRLEEGRSNGYWLHGKSFSGRSRWLKPGELQKMLQ